MKHIKKQWLLLKLLPENHDNMNEIIVAVDTQIVMVGCGMASRDPAPCYCALLAAFHNSAILALDKHTRQEYNNNMGSTSEGRRWLTLLATRDRIKFYDRVPNESRKTKVALNKIGFSKGDFRFVRLALATTLRCLVAEEPHFVNVRDLLRKTENIRIHDAQAAYDLIAANLTDDTPV
jgi:hypothetical protein